jgi:hypothetical protein
MKHPQLLRPLLVPGLFRQENSVQQRDFKSWIASGNYIVRNISSTSNLELEVNNEYSFYNMLAYDICRMSSASFETMHHIKSGNALPKSFGWIAIKSYYAAFFSAHSILRCFGYICSQLEKGHVKQISDYGQAVGLSGVIKPEAGYFCGYYDRNSRLLSIKKMKNTHEDTWHALINCLNAISSDVLKVSGLSVNKQMVSASIDDLTHNLTDRGRLSKGSFLSQFRNAVNYRQEHDSWHPYGRNSIRTDKIISLMSTWQSKADLSSVVWKESLDAYNFFVACRGVINLNFLLIMLIVENSDGASNLFKRWPVKLLNLSAAN